MNSRLTDVLFTVLVAATILVTSTTNSVRSQTSEKRDDSDLETVLAKLHDPNLRKSSPKEFTETIRKAGMLASANTFAQDDDAIPSNIYSTELLVTLVGLLDFEQPRGDSGFQLGSSRPMYPAVDSIALMRKPALPWLVEVLENENPESLKHKNALFALRLILDKDDVAAINYLQEQGAAAPTDRERSHLLAAADLVQAEWKKNQQRIGQ